MTDDWCPENDGAYRAEMAAIHKDKTEATLRALSAERDALKAELADAVGLVQEIIREDDDAIYSKEAANALTRVGISARAFLARHQKDSEG